MQEIKYGPVLRRAEVGARMRRIDHGHLRDLDKVGVVKNAGRLRLDVAVITVLNLCVDFVVGVFKRPDQVEFQTPGAVLVRLSGPDCLAVVIHCYFTAPGGLARDCDLLKSCPGRDGNAGCFDAHRNRADGLHDIFRSFFERKIGMGLFDARGRGHDVEPHCSLPGIHPDRDLCTAGLVILLHRACCCPAVRRKASLHEGEAVGNFKSERLPGGLCSLLPVDLIGRPQSHILACRDLAGSGPETSGVIHCIVQLRLVKIRNGHVLQDRDHAVVDGYVLSDKIRTFRKSEFRQSAKGIQSLQKGCLLDQDQGIVSCGKRF